MLHKIWIGVLIILLAIGSISAHLPSNALVTQVTPQTTKVLICDSNGSYAYHSYRCAGLQRCKHAILEITKAEALRQNRTPCKYCYK